MATLPIWIMNNQTPVVNVVAVVLVLASTVPAQRLSDDMATGGRL